MKGFVTTQIFGMVHDLIFSEDYKARSRTEERYFTRTRKLSFVDSIILVLRNTRRSMQVELNAFLEELKMVCNGCSKQAFSKRRQHIKPEAIEELAHLTSTEFYKIADYKTYRGYVLAAIDGSKVNLPDSQELEDIYDVQESKGVPQVQGLLSECYDVMNGITLDVCLDSCRADERELAKRHFERIKEYAFPKTMVLMDRGYPGSELIETMMRQNLSFVMRCSKVFLQKISLTGDDCVVEHTFKTGITLKLRYVTFPIAGTEEVLVTNIFDKTFSVADFKEIYHMRWGIETAYNHLKNYIELENFSGITNIAVLQDVYACAFLSNMANIIVFDMKPSFNDKHNTQKNKYIYKQNLAQTIGELKLSVAKMLLCASNKQRNRCFRKIQDRLIRCTTPIKPGRSFPRNRPHKSRKYSQHSKPV